MSRLKPILIIDSDAHYLRTLKSEWNSDEMELVSASSPREARIRISDLSQAFLGIFVDPKVEAPKALPLIRWIHLNRPGTPLYIMHEGDAPPFTLEELPKLAIHGARKKPLTYEDLKQLILPELQGFDADGSLQNPSTLPVDSEEFVPILARNFLSGKKSFFDLFVRLDSGKYMKLLLAGDEFSRDRIEGYLKKGVTYFYLKRESQAAYLSFCDQLVSALGYHPAIEAEAKGHLVLNLGQETISFLKRQGLGEGRIQHAVRFVEKLRDTIAGSGLSKHPEIAEFISKVGAYDHGVSTAMIASLLCQKMGMGTRRIQRILGLVCLFHDIALDDPESWSERARAGTLTGEEQFRYQEHPLHGADILSKIQGVDPLVPEIISQHHERMSGKGFPRKLGAGRIHLLAELVGLADETSFWIQRALRDTTIDPISIVTKEALPRFSHRIGDVFVSVFMRS